MCEVIFDSILRRTQQQGSEERNVHMRDTSISYPAGWNCLKAKGL
jgi:hypothetical protein